MLRFSTPAGDGWLERVWCCGGAGVVDTLLGPEATGPSHALWVCGGCCFVWLPCFWKACPVGCVGWGCGVVV